MEPHASNSSTDSRKHKGLVECTKALRSRGYKLDKLLQTSVYGGVWRCEKKGKQYAVKISRRSAASSGNVRKESPRLEVHVLKMLQMRCRNREHPHIVKLVEFWEDEVGTLFTVLDYVDGHDLFSLLATDGPMHEDRLRLVACQLLDAAHFFHTAGVLHLDLSLENLLLEVQSGRIKVCDFGASKLRSQKPTVGGCRQVGKLNYMAPEVMNQTGDYRASADVFSVGVILATLALGHPLYDLKAEGGRVAWNLAVKGKLRDILRAYGYAPGRLSNDFLDLCGKMLLHAPEKRISMEGAMNHRWIATCRQEKEEKNGNHPSVSSAVGSVVCF